MRPHLLGCFTQAVITVLLLSLLGLNSAVAKTKCETELETIPVEEKFVSEFLTTIKSEAARIGMQVTDLRDATVKEVVLQNARQRAFIVNHGQKAWWFIENNPRLAKKTQAAGKIDGILYEKDSVTLFGAGAQPFQTFIGEQPLKLKTGETCRFEEPRNFETLSEATVRSYHEFVTQLLATSSIVDENKQNTEKTVAEQFISAFGHTLLFDVQQGIFDFKTLLVPGKLLGEGDAFIFLPSNSQDKAYHFVIGRTLTSRNEKYYETLKLVPHFEPEIDQNFFVYKIASTSNPNVWRSSAPGPVQRYGDHYLFRTIQKFDGENDSRSALFITKENALGEIKRVISEKDLVSESLPGKLHQQLADIYLDRFIEQTLNVDDYQRFLALKDIQILGTGHNLNDPSKVFATFTHNYQNYFFGQNVVGRYNWRDYENTLTGFTDVDGQKLSRDPLYMTIGNEIVLPSGKILIFKSVKRKFAEPVFQFSIADLATNFDLVLEQMKQKRR